MTIQEYLSPQYFPLTTQAGLAPLDQLQLDALNYDEYAAAQRKREPLDDRERAVGRELETKHAARDSVLRQIQEQEGRGNSPAL